MKITKKKALVMLLSGILGVSLTAGALCGMREKKSVRALADEDIVATTTKSGVLTGLTSEQIVAQMGIGWNLGNTFDATGGRASDPFSQEKSWGNPEVTEDLIDAVAAAGFNTIRIPVTWNNYISREGDAFIVNEAFLERVRTVVNYAYENGMFIILNVHHESWVNYKDLDKRYEKTGEKLTAVWAQIADYFADFDQHLIFEGLNEPRMAGTSVEWNGNQAGYAAVNYLNQIFVETIRASHKGYNQERCLMIPGYAASSSASIMDTITIPTINGEAAKNLIVSVHCYSPYDFCLSDNMKDFNENLASCTGDIRQVFRNIETNFLDNGIPVIIGETSATNKDNTEARERWASFMAKMSQGYGVPIVIWDNGADGNSGGECHAHINRQTNTWNYPTVVDALFEGMNSVKRGSMLQDDEASGENTSAVDGSVIWKKAEGLTSTAQWDASYISMAAQPTFVVPGRELAVVYSGNGEPKLVFDSAAKSVWWMPVDPERIETKGDKKVAYFSYDGIMAVLNNNKITDPADLRNMNVIAVNNNITTYELAAVGGTASVTYKANGVLYCTGTQTPDDPEFADMTFAGWYTSKDYREGTEFIPGEIKADTTVYAKFVLNDGVIDTMETIKQKAEVTPTPVPTATPMPTATPTPTPVLVQEPTSAPEVTISPEPTDKTDTAVDDTQKENSGDAGTMVTMITIFVAIFGIGIVAFIAVVVLKKKK